MNDGTAHWLRQRITALAMIPLTIWFVWSSSHLFTLDRAGFQSWLNLHHHANLILFVIFISTLFYHMKLGVQVVIEDYVHSRRYTIWRYGVIRVLRRFSAQQQSYHFCR